jgi:hypothetical protein
MNSSQETNSGSEKWWTYDTPYDIVWRRELLDAGDARRVEDIDAYIAFINEEMSSRYMVATRFREKGGKNFQRDPSNWTHIFKRNPEGIYEPYCTVAMAGQFYGEKIFLADDTPVVVNQEVGLGVTPSESVRFTSPASANTQYGAKRQYRERIFASTVRKILSLDKGGIYDLSGWYSGYLEDTEDS